MTTDTATSLSDTVINPPTHNDISDQSETIPAWLLEVCSKSRKKGYVALGDLPLIMAVEPAYTDERIENIYKKCGCDSRQAITSKIQAWFDIFERIIFNRIQGLGMESDIEYGSLNLFKFDKKTRQYPPLDRKKDIEDSVFVALPELDTYLTTEFKISLPTLLYDKLSIPTTPPENESSKEKRTRKCRKEAARQWAENEWLTYGEIYASEPMQKILKYEKKDGGYSLDWMQKRIKDINPHPTPGTRKGQTKAKR